MFDITPQHAFFVAIDSDGCAFDTMELKHKECFIPEIIRHYSLQAISKFVRETAEFINLYSKSRGVNRFPGLVQTLKMLNRRPEVAARGVRIEIPASLVRWVNEEKRLGNPTLAAQVKATNDPALAQCLAWSEGVNRAIDDMVHAVPPFPFVRECLEKLAPQADLIVCSATPAAALKKEWSEHGIDRFVRDICGQEAGTKKEILAAVKRYPAGHALMIGDAPGDHAAAVANGCLFYPINPGREDASWERLHREGIERFLNGTFAGEYETRLLDEFNALLPDKPAWE